MALLNRVQDASQRSTAASDFDLHLCMGLTERIPWVALAAACEALQVWLSAVPNGILLPEVQKQAHRRVQGQIYRNMKQLVFIGTTLGLLTAT